MDFFNFREFSLSQFSFDNIYCRGFPVQLYSKALKQPIKFSIWQVSSLCTRKLSSEKEETCLMKYDTL